MITDEMDRVRDALQGLRIALAADSYDLDVCSYKDHRLKLAIKAGPGACPECLIPEKMMADLVRTQLPSDIITDVIDISIAAA